MDTAKRNIHLFRSDRATGHPRAATPVERLFRTLTATLDAAESEPLRVPDRDEEDER
ncbi:hypothetical protein M0R88_18110 [Halorussus gelatinilyticus]|uniref:Uncharacterized protein n=1 Tax=Halorussus gelatinilyticus TaxID=2937524 RepID=A0A8U0II79_9EURY|nr:hypothetical protein [Halorussus gelatinilyticus]UPW00405.1 hypothetical protein M0R88_18110 [Halorussus gelatinilyticus]